jgi:hypothetical protein
MKLEVVVLGVFDVDRANAFGFHGLPGIDCTCELPSLCHAAYSHEAVVL